MGANRLIRLGAARRAMWRIGQAPQRRRGADLPRPMAGFFYAVASLRPFADAQASPCGARLAPAKNKPGQLFPIYQEPL